jgi:3-hydroxybutyryl-CoA dehydrogenase
MEIKTISIIGAGQMGHGIAQSLALTGYDVLINDISLEIINSGLENIKKNLTRLALKKNIPQEGYDKILSRIKPTLNLEDIGASDLIIEAATEKEEIKNSIFENLVPYLLPHTILTSNTSSISITRLASRTDRPEKFMGFHFMNPVSVMQLVELIRGIATNQETFDSCKQVVERLGKTVTQAQDFPGFIINRVLMPMINEAVYTLFEGVGSVESIDQ